MTTLVRERKRFARRGTNLWLLMFGQDASEHGKTRPTNLVSTKTKGSKNAVIARVDGTTARSCVTSPTLLQPLLHIFIHVPGGCKDSRGF